MIEPTPRAAFPRWLCTDLDGTLLGGTPQSRQRLGDLLEELDFGVIFVTGRGIESVLPLLSDPSVPTPEYVICDVGGTVVEAESLLPVQPLQSDIDQRWPGAQVVMKQLAGIPGLERQDVPQERRCSFLVPDRDVIETVRSRIAPLECEVLFSAGEYLDVLPRGVSKGSTLRDLLALLEIDTDSVLVAGDTLNDLTLFETGYPGVVVGNAESALVDATRDLPNVTFAEAEGAGGIIEAILPQSDQSPTVETEFGDAELVMVYHRMPFDEVVRAGKTLHRRPRSPNGIIPTLVSYFASGRPGAWVAWSQQASRSPEGFEQRVRFDDDNLPNLWASRIALTKKDVVDFYKVFSKEALWPVIFSFLGQAVFRHDHWEHYVEINRLFAERTAREAAEGAVIWIHDYNLWMVPAFLRALRPDVRIAFFHHTAFPPPDVFNVLPWRREIVGSLIQCDYVGFHIPRYAENFADVVRAHTPAATVARESCAPRYLTFGCALGLGEMTTALRVGKRRIGIGAHPVGVDVHRVKELLRRESMQSRIDKLTGELGDLRIILSVERLDYVKGPLEKLRAYEKLLEEHPKLHGKVVLVNVCTPAADGMTAYKSVRLQVDQAVGRINGRFSRLDWTPVRYFFRNLPFEDVVAYYAAADIAWITPLRDGLNLVAKEYVAAKAATGREGTLVLSEFAGAAVELHGALLTNPYDATDLAASLLRALTLDPDERRDRMKRLSSIVTHYDHEEWSRAFLAAVDPRL